VPSAREIVTFRDATPPGGADAWVPGGGPSPAVALVDPDPTWPQRFATLAEMIRGALGPVALAVEHVGSTAVPGLAAKPVIDIDLTVPDSDDESAYVPALERCGFALKVREPWWYGHRCLRLDAPACFLHVFPPDCAEAARHRIFRDWLTAQPEDRALYAATKRAAMAETQASGGHAMDYNARKQAVVREIYDRAFRAAGLL
jgi:GrpB-like predicted nucleotidyltransferase (UPF0157 family)